MREQEREREREREREEAARRRKGGRLCPGQICPVEGRLLQLLLGAARPLPVLCGGERAREGLRRPFALLLLLSCAYTGGALCVLCAC